MIGRMIARPLWEQKVRTALAGNPVVTLLGPRQCGKTTLARMMTFDRPVERFDLENPLDLARLENPILTLRDKGGLAVIDEVQRMPSLFGTIRHLVDRPDNRLSFLLLGSASPFLVKGVSETLAGRSAFIDMSGFSLDEVGASSLADLWFRGMFPRSFLAVDDGQSGAWRSEFIRSILERDIPQLGFTVPAATLRRFWTMLAHYHGNVWNASEFARSLGAGEKAARRYLDIVTGTYMVLQLPPWFENIGKRQVKAPKVYIRDSGLLHTLLGIADRDGLQSHPKTGASWEGFVVSQLLAHADPGKAYFWSTYSGAELDLLLFHGGKRLGFEMKYADAPRLTRSMTIARDDLSLDRLYVVYPGEARYPLAERIEAAPLADVLRELFP